MKVRKCKKCKNTYPLTKEFFARDIKRNDGFFYICKNCDNKRKNKNNSGANIPSVYAVFCGLKNEYVKIGHTTNYMKDRMTSLQNGNPFPISIKHNRITKTRDIAVSIELTLQAFYARFHVWGEWFYIPNHDIILLGSYEKPDIESRWGKEWLFHAKDNYWDCLKHWTHYEHSVLLKKDGAWENKALLTYELLTYFDISLKELNQVCPRKYRHNILAFNVPSVLNMFPNVARSQWDVLNDKGTFFEFQNNGSPQ